MKMSSLNINNLKNNNLIYYIYQVDLSVFGIETDEHKYVVVGDKEFINNNDLDPNEVWLFSIEEWFKLVEKGEILPWICACVNKKFIYKEHVKLMMSTNPLQLRKLIDEDLLDVYLNWDTRTASSLFMVIAEIMLAVQIIENHKIVNFNSPKKYYKSLSDTITKEDFQALIGPELESLYKLTDGLLHKERMDKIWAKIEAAEAAEREVSLKETEAEQKDEKNENDENI